MKPVDFLITIYISVYFNLISPLSYFFLFCPALIRLMTDSKLRRQSLQSVSDVMYQVPVFESINSNKELKFFEHIQDIQIRIIFSNSKTRFYFCDEYLFCFQYEISYIMPPSITVLWKFAIDNICKFQGHFKIVNMRPPVLCHTN